MATIGYYDMSIETGAYTQVDEIAVNGHEAVEISDLNTGSLEHLDTLYVQNPDNGGFGGEYIANMPAIASAVNGGMNLIVFDRAVTGAEMILPGGEAIMAVRDFADDTNVNVASGAPIAFSDGPAGRIDDSTFDGGNSSSHGYVSLNSLPPGAVPLLTTSDPNHVVAFVYPYGAGKVFYSTMPIDFYSGGGNAAITQEEINTLLGNILGIMCFASGTMIRTPTGAVAVQDLCPGDLVTCIDGLARPVRWIGATVVTGQALHRKPSLYPVRIRRGSLGRDIPSRDLWVSRQHRMMVPSLGGDSPSSVLVAACKLVGLPGIAVDRSINEIRYFHILLDEHQLIWAEDAPAETLFLGLQALQTLTRAQRREIALLFPSIVAGTQMARSVLPLLTPQAQRRAVRFHAETGKGLNGKKRAKVPWQGELTRAQTNVETQPMF